MSITKKENMLKAIYFEKPEYIPTSVSINTACWYQYDQDDLCELIDTHKFLFPDYKLPPKNYKRLWATVRINIIHTLMILACKLYNSSHFAI